MVLPVAAVESVIAHPNFRNIRSAITATSRTLSSTFVNYLIHRISNTSTRKILRFGGSVTGKKIFTKHVDPIIQTRDVKIQRGSMQGEYSTKIRCYEHICEKLPLISETTKSVKGTHSPFFTSAKHQETNLAALKKYENIIKRLVSNLEEVLDPFSSGAAKNIETGVLLYDLIVKGLLKSEEIGEKHF